MSSVSTITRLQCADLFASKSLNAVVKSSVTTRTHLHEQFGFASFFTGCKRDPVYVAEEVVVNGKFHCIALYVLPRFLYYTYISYRVDTIRSLNDG